jgi:hypothetical protein
MYLSLSLVAADDYAGYGSHVNGPFKPVMGTGSENSMGSCPAVVRPSRGPELDVLRPSGLRTPGSVIVRGLVSGTDPSSVAARRRKLFFPRERATGTYFFLLEYA